MRRRIIPAASAAVLLLAGATGCSAAKDSAAECGDALQPGSLSSSVTVLGEPGEKPEVSIPDDVTIESSQRTIVSEADDRSDLAGDDTLLSVNLALYESSSGDELMSSESFGQDRGSSFVLVEPDSENPIANALRCAAPGDRVVAAFSPEDSQLLAGQGAAMSPDTAIVGVIDVVNVDSLTPSGKKRNLPSGFPAVVTNDAGQPGVVLPPTSAPEKTRVAPRIVGEGPEVGADDPVVVKAMTVGWDGSIQSNGWDEESPTAGPQSLGTEEQNAQAPAGMGGASYRDQLTGQTVGSQVVVVEGGENPSVSVVDILSVG